MSAATPWPTRFSLTMGVFPTAWVMFSSAPFIIDRSLPPSRSTSRVASLLTSCPSHLACSRGSRRLGGVPEPFDAVVLIAHGARDARWKQPFYAMKDEIASRLRSRPVGLAFLEFASPPFAEVADDVCA